MKVKSNEPTVVELTKRLSRLEKLIESRSSSSTYHSFDELMERQWIKDSKRTREILQRTFGMVSKKRGREWLKAVDEGRNEWK